MSIIERALDKLRTHSNEGSHQAPRPPARLREPAVTPAHERRPPAETIEVDLEALRALGLVPPAAFGEQITEQFRRVKWPLLESALGRGAAGAPPGNRVLITSSIAGEGKTFVCFNLALSIARERDLDVLLVDGDVAKRHLTRVLGADARPGLTDAAADAQLDVEQLVLGTSIEGLTFLPSGRSTTIASELFTSRRMAELVERLHSADPRRIVLFDCSPLLATNETQVLASLVDQVVLVVCAESTSQPLVLEAISLLDRGKQIRCLLNQTRLSRVNEYYYYGYGYPANEQPRQP
ncbi:MAG TPA: AAA family ATPase [Steroidobacteraceae bacterium]|nr:AAA family ATPase [Steroidobacteraceae bacterium]